MGAVVAGGMLAWSVSTASAATINYDGCGGIPCYPTGVSGLVVGDLTYDITFSTGYYADLFPQGDLFANSVEIAIAINAVLTEAGARELDSNPGSVGIEFSIPLSISIDGGTLGITVGKNPLGTWIVYPKVGMGVLDLGRFAVPTLVAPVPIPATLPLLMSALGFFGFMGWRRKRVAAA